MNRLTLNDGTVLEDSTALDSGFTLWLYLYGVTFDEAYRMLSDRDLTSVIYAEEDGETTIYRGYTDLFFLQREDGGRISGGLKHA